MVFRRFRGTTAAYPQRGHATAALMVEKRTHAGPRYRGQVVGIFMAPNDAGAMPTLFQVLTPWVSDGMPKNWTHLLRKSVVEFHSVCETWSKNQSVVPHHSVAGGHYRRAT